jgi:hypothetical protein
MREIHLSSDGRSSNGQTKTENRRSINVTMRAPNVRFALFAVAAALVLSLAPAALAGKGKPTSGSGGGTITLRLLNSTDGLPHVGQKVTFDVFTTATQYPWVTLDCYVNGVLVYEASRGIFPTSLSQVFTLASNTWLSGAADCTAWLQNWDNYGKHGSITNLASTSFHVYP